MSVVSPAALEAVTEYVSVSAGVTALSCKVEETGPDEAGRVGLVVMVTTPTPSVRTVPPCIQTTLVRGRLKPEIETDKVRASPAITTGEATWLVLKSTVGATV